MIHWIVAALSRRYLSRFVVKSLYRGNLLRVEDQGLLGTAHRITIVVA